MNSTIAAAGAFLNIAAVNAENKKNEKKCGCKSYLLSVLLTIF